MAISLKQIAEWRTLKNQGMTSAIGEYTPSEFWELLDEYESVVNNYTRLIEQNAALVKALERLTNEVAGTLYLAPEGIRELIGNINFSILELRVKEAREVLAAISKERKS